MDNQSNTQHILHITDTCFGYHEVYNIRL